MPTAIIQTDGQGTPTGVWVAEVDHGAPDVTFADPADELDAERMLAEALTIMGAQNVDPAAGWPVFLASLFDRQNHITVERVWVDDWNGTAPELLAAAQAAHKAGTPLASVAA